MPQEKVIYCPKNALHTIMKVGCRSATQLRLGMYMYNEYYYGCHYLRDKITLQVNNREAVVSVLTSFNYQQGYI